MVSIQAPLQLLVPAAQSSEHFPFEHTLPGAQGVSQPPQCAGSALVSTHPRQLVRGASQLTPHLPASQLGVPPARSHFPPQAPQLSTSLLRSTHRLPQGVNPSSQPKLQRPAAQPGWAWAGAVHVASQPPQLLGSVVTITQLLPQTVSPLRHDSTGRTHRRVLGSQT